ncbi:glutathione peroxidase [Paenisporosarcina quisquiliarum]|uniref:Glutathione peroxidase n=1 Tax=Paenisporosarcina quisquiliarum TaxID=365346 RepID=A0A9X3LIQ0_9BACL|nr:glutathione peroxidase [Paenisporosarcina quisquiliarum]MCZ8538631.1 glutathione peroxidase [Paenisporosarcina quisquiliarum]
MTNVYDYAATLANGEEVSLSEYKGQPMVIVNTASKCGFTPQFQELQELYDEYKDQGLVVLGFPCGQFSNQEFDDVNETMEFCQLNYGVSFPMFQKIDVKGESAHPLFKHLVSEKKGLLTEDIKWNFTKFLVDPDGQVVKRYAPQSSPKKIEDDLLKYI